MIEILELTLEERATWGECPVCHAQHLQNCNAREGDDTSNIYFTHIARLINAPKMAASDDE